MKTALKATMIALVLVTLGLGGVARADSKDPTKYDCRVFTGYKLVARPGSKTPDKVAIFVCPHTDKMAAGKCETNWLLGMRCTE